MKNIALITGASSGIGRDIARIIDKRELFLDEIWIVGRNREALKNIAKYFEHRTRIIDIDLEKPNSLVTMKKIIDNDEIRIRILVNSAGFGSDGNFEKMDYQKIRGMIRLNIEALTSITYNSMKRMDENSRIINIASAAAFLPQPNFAVYAATKSYVLSFTRALKYEAEKRGIVVTAVCPGPVKTNFFNNVNFMKRFPKANSLDVALQAYNDNYRGYDLSVHSVLMHIFKMITSIIPHEFLLRGYRLYLDARNKCR